MFNVKDNSRTVAVLMSFYDTTNDEKLAIVKACDKIALPMLDDSFSRLYTAMGAMRGSKVISDKFWYIMYFEGTQEKLDDVKQALEAQHIQIDQDEVGMQFIQLVEFTGKSLEEICKEEVKNKLDDDQRFLLL